MGELARERVQVVWLQKSLLTTRHATFSVIFPRSNPTCNPLVFDPHGILLSTSKQKLWIPCLDTHIVGFQKSTAGQPYPLESSWNA